MDVLRAYRGTLLSALLEVINTAGPFSSTKTGAHEHWAELQISVNVYLGLL